MCYCPAMIIVVSNLWRDHVTEASNDYFFKWPLHLSGISLMWSLRCPETDVTPYIFLFPSKTSSWRCCKAANPHISKAWTTKYLAFLRSDLLLIRIVGDSFFCQWICWLIADRDWPFILSDALSWRMCRVIVCLCWSGLMYSLFGVWWSRTEGEVGGAFQSPQSPVHTYTHTYAHMHTHTHTIHLVWGWFFVTA